VAVSGSGGCGGAPKLGRRRCRHGSSAQDEEDEEEALPMDLGPGHGGWWLTNIIWEKKGIKIDCLSH